MKRSILFPAALALLVVSMTAPDALAQPGITVGAGAGAVLDERRNLPDDIDDLSHKMAFLSFRLPTTPLELRAEGLWPDDPIVDGARALVASAMFTIPLGIVIPYAQAGYGDYNFGDPDRKKWSAGIGARVHLGSLGVFVEATRYNRMETDLITAGLTLTTGRR